jgi:hypothetical protein
VRDVDAYPESRVRNSQPAGIGRVVALGDGWAWNNLGRNVVFASRAFEPRAVFDQTQFPDDDEPSQYDLDVHAIVDVPDAGAVVVLNHLGILRGFRRSELDGPGPVRRIDPVWTRMFEADVERVVAVGDRLVGSRPRGQRAGGVVVSEPVVARADGALLDARVELGTWAMVTALDWLPVDGHECIAVGGNGRIALAPIDGGRVGALDWDVGVEFEPAAFAWDGRALWAAGPDLGAIGIDDYDWGKVRGGGFAALDPSDGAAVVRGRFTHDPAWGSGGTAVVFAGGVACAIGRTGELDVYNSDDGTHRRRTTGFAAQSLGIAHAATVHDTLLFGFNRGGYRLHTVAVPALAG